MKTPVSTDQFAEIDINCFIVPDKSIEECAMNAGYPEIPKFILEEGAPFKHNPSQNRYMGVWHPKVRMISHTVIWLISLMRVTIKGRVFGGRSAIIEELISHEHRYLKLDRDFSITALGESIRGCHFVSSGIKNGTKNLYASYPVDAYGIENRFLVVFEETVSQSG